MDYKIKILLERQFGSSLPVSSSPTEVRFNCPFCVKHGKTPDTKHHLYINTEKLVGHCFRCGEIVKFSKDKIISTDSPVREIEKIKQKYVLKRLPKCTKLETDNPGYEYLIHRFKKLMSVEEIENRIDELNMMYCVDERIKKHYSRIIFPVFYESNLVGFQGRSIYGEEPKYLTENINGFNVKDYFFNINNALGSKRVYVFEGPLDVFPCNNECIAVMGKEFKAHQIRLLSNNFKEVVICLDSDAVMGLEKIAKQLVGIADKLGIITLETGDPGEIGMKIFDNEVYWVNSVLDIIGLQNFLVETSIERDVSLSII